MPATISAVVFPAPHEEAQIREFTKPTLQDGEALLRVVYSEVCGTDIHLQEGLLAETPYPLIPGHAVVGHLEEMEGEIRDVHDTPLHVGDRVTFLDVHGTCGSCWYCLVAKASTRCPHRKVYGITYSARDGLLGGWSEYVHLKRGVRILPLPESLSFEAVIGGGCGLPTALHAVGRADIALGDVVLVQGTGPVGLSAIALSRLRGAYRIITIGAPAKRLEMATQMGADIVLDVERTTEEQRRAAILEATQGRGPDVAIEASGNPVAVNEGLNLVRDSGTYTVVGQYTDRGPVAINPHLQLNKKHLDLRGVWGIDYSHLYKALLILDRYNDQFHWERLITHRFRLDQANEALAAVRSGEAIKAVITPS